MTADASFDIREIPFSTRGSWLNLSPVVALDTRADAVHLVSHSNGMHGVFALRPQLAGVDVETTWDAEPSRFQWRSAAGAVTAAFDGPAVIRLRGHGLALRLADAAGALTSFTGTYLFVDAVDGTAVFTSYETGRRYRVTMLSGTIDVIGDEALGRAERAVVIGGHEGVHWEAAVEEMTSAAEPYRFERTFDEIVQSSTAAFNGYLESVAPWRSGETPAAARAAYVLWSATVAPEGLTTRESVLMSMHWMDKLWSWDHCFNALALAPGLPDVALDQFLAPFDHQDATGALPDSITHSEVLYNYVKPPIHGWALRLLRSSLGRSLSTAELERIYEGLARWSTFWLDRRRCPDHALPYYQHGNDSGWDNSSTFDLDRVIEAPDLAAFLVLQFEVLDELAAELGRPVPNWKLARDELLDALLGQLWTGEAFVAVGAHSGRRSTSTSLLNLLPLILGDRLPAEVREILATRVGEHLTPYGLATEPVTSQHYEPDGYWRGPIWAPSTALIEDGLRQCGYTDLADKVRYRYLRLCEQSGFAENFDAQTGSGLRDRAYTWTAAVYLRFARVVAGDQP